MSIALRYAAKSDVGLLRANNQDSAYAGSHLLVVADGMGGHAGGDTASSLAIANLAPLDDEALSSSEILQRLEDTIERARLDLVAHARADHKLGGMGTTVTALLRSGNKLAMAHLGDSRAYLLRDEEFDQITVDHTFVQHLVDTGKITPEEAEHHPQRSVVMRVLGDFDIDFEPDLSMREARAGDRWLLCSDGLSGYVSHDTIERTLREVPDPAACADRLIQYALKAGGPDNITVIVADVVDLDALPDGAVPAPDVQVVGAAAVTRAQPTVAGDGPAARAASLAADTRATDETSPDHEPDDVEEARAAVRQRRRHRVRWSVAVVLLLAVLGGGSWFGYRWTQTQFYVGTFQGEVTIFRGIPQTVGPLDLSHPYEATDIAVDTLPSYVTTQLANTIGVSSIEEARAKVANIRAAAVPSTGSTAVPSPSDTAAPTDATTGSS